MTAATTAAAMPAITISAITEAVSSERMPAVASALSSATTAYQSVPGIAWARISFVLPFTSISSGRSVLKRAASLSLVRAGATSETGFKVSFASGCATIWPLASINMPKLAGVG